MGGEFAYKMAARPVLRQYYRIAIIIIITHNSAMLMARMGANYTTHINELMVVKSDSNRPHRGNRLSWYRTDSVSDSMAEWLSAWDTLAVMKLWRREVVSSIPDRGNIVG